MRSLWSDRWYYSLEPAIIQSQQNLNTQIATNKEINAQTRQALTTIATTLAGLRRFSAAQTRLFQDLFSPKPEILIPDPLRYPKEWVLRRTFNQIAFDLEVLQRAASQRLGAAIGSAGAKTLQLADQYAYHFVLRPAIDFGYIQETTIITYFQKNPFVRVIPYAPAAIIGIPYATLNVTRNHEGGPHTPPQLGSEPNLQSFALLDFAATAHEIGHYIYHHGTVPTADKRKSIQKICADISTKWGPQSKQAKIQHTTRLTILQKSIEKRFADLTAYSNSSEEQEAANANLQASLNEDIKAILPELVLKLGAWTEEIFADIYGCLIAGPIIAFAFIELIIDNNPRWLASKDSEHPPTIIRPLIYLKVLEKMGCEQDVHVLQKLWYAWLQERGIDRPDEDILVKIGAYIDRLIEGLEITGEKAPSRWPGPKLGNKLPNVDTNDFESIFTILRSSVIQLLRNDLRQADNTPLQSVPMMELSQNCIHGQHCQWTLLHHGQLIRTGQFWRVNMEKETTTVIPGTFIGPETAPGILELEAHAKQPQLKIEPNRWKHIFLMNGWASGGPEEDGVGS